MEVIEVGVLVIGGSKVVFYFGFLYLMDIIKNEEVF